MNLLKTIYWLYSSIAHLYAELDKVEEVSKNTVRITVLHTKFKNLPWEHVVTRFFYKRYGTWYEVKGVVANPVAWWGTWPDALEDLLIGYEATRYDNLKITSK